jgi:hypothetical protein
MNADDRFWTFIAPGCWEWTGTMAHGYGYFWSGRTNRRAHRVMWERVFGPIPEGMNVRHRCDNPRCVRPDHLELGTQAENIGDVVARGRRWKGGRPIERHRGEWNGRAKLTWAIVEEIRASYTGARGQKSDLAAKYDVSKSSIGRILDRKSWTHADGG